MAPTTIATDEYHLSLRAVRERCFRVQEAGVRNRLRHFDVDPSKLQDVVTFVVSLIKRDFDSPNQMPVHGIWRYFDAGGRPRIQQLINSWASLGFDAKEQTRRVLDLFVVGVLLDTDAGNHWSYRENVTGRTHKRSEGIAVAVLDLFMSGAFSSDVKEPHRVDCEYTCMWSSNDICILNAHATAEGLLSLSIDTLKQGFQVNERNILIGLEDRLEILRYLGNVLRSREDYFQSSGAVPRPGNLMGKTTKKDDADLC